MKRYLFLTLLALSAMTSYAYDVCIDGIYYNLVLKGKVAIVTNGNSHYNGDIVIPEKIIYDDAEYTVSSIGDNAFYGCSSLTSIVIPNSVTSIGISAFQDCI